METIPASSDDAIARATAALDAGELVIMPGDQRYLLAADALDDAAVERLLLALARAADDPPLVLVSGYEDLHHVAYGGALARDLAERHWPGPAALQLKARPWLPETVSAGTDRVLASAPAQRFARDLARHFGPLAVAALDAEDAPAAAARAPGARMLVDAGALPGGRMLVVDAAGAEAKVIRDGASAPGR